MDLVTFLRARLDEREAAAKAGGEAMGYDEPVFPDYRTYDGPDQEAADRYLTVFSPAYVLADIAAKRRIMDWVESELADDAEQVMPREIGCYLAAPFAQHPDFDPAWSVEP